MDSLHIHQCILNAPFTDSHVSHTREQHPPFASHDILMQLQRVEEINDEHQHSSAFHSEDLIFSGKIYMDYFPIV